MRVGILYQTLAASDDKGLVASEGERLASDDMELWRAKNMVLLQRLKNLVFFKKLVYKF